MEQIVSGICYPHTMHYAPREGDGHFTDPCAGDNAALDLPASGLGELPGKNDES